MSVRQETTCVKYYFSLSVVYIFCCVMNHLQADTDSFLTFNPTNPAELDFLGKRIKVIPFESTFRENEDESLKKIISDLKGADKKVVVILLGNTRNTNRVSLMLSNEASKDNTI